MSLASIVITSVVFAFLQYSEITSKDRIEEAKKLLSDLDVYGDLRASDEARVTYDELINYEIRRMPWLKGILFAQLVALTILHAAGAYIQANPVDPDQASFLSNVVAGSWWSWWPVIATVSMSGIRMSWAAAMVSRFRRRVDRFKIFLEGWRAGRNG